LGFVLGAVERMGKIPIMTSLSYQTAKFRSSRACLTLVGILLLITMVAGACGPAVPEAEYSQEQGLTQPQAIPLGSGEKLSVVATTNIVGDVVKNVGADLIDLSVLMAVGVDPHTYVPTPAHAVLIHDAHVIFANGAGLEADLEEMCDSAGGDAVPVHLSDGLKLRALSSTAEHGEQELQDHDHEDMDPHVWFSVPNVKHWVESIEHTLSTLDPANAQTYELNARAYRDKLADLDAWVREQVALVPGPHRKLVTNHPSFGYLADQYGLEQVGAFYPISPSSEPSAQDIAGLEDVIREYDVLAVFTESTVNPSLAEQVARDVGIELVPLYTGSLGGPGSGAETYVDLMRYDVRAIVDALH